MSSLKRDKRSFDNLCEVKLSGRSMILDDYESSKLSLHDTSSKDWCKIFYETLIELDFLSSSKKIYHRDIPLLLFSIYNNYSDDIIDIFIDHVLNKINENKLKKLKII